MQTVFQKFKDNEDNWVKRMPDDVEIISNEDGVAAIGSTSKKTGKITV